MKQDDRPKKAPVDQSEIDDNLSGVRHRIVVFSGKGGVGKTTVSTSLACALSNQGNTVGLLDADITGPDVPHMMGLDASLRQIDGKILPATAQGVKVVSIACAVSNTQPIMWRGPMRSKMLIQFLRDVSWGNLDYLFADLPPGTGDEVMTMAQNMKPDYAIIVTMPQQISLLDSARAIGLAKKLEIPNIGLIENMSGFVCPHCHEKVDLFGSGGGLKQAKEMGVDFLGALPMEIEARLASDHRTPLQDAHGSSLVSAIHAMADKLVRTWADDETKYVRRV